VVRSNDDHSNNSYIAAQSELEWFQVRGATAKACKQEKQLQFTKEHKFIISNSKSLSIY